MSQPKQWVKDRYGAIARQAQPGCCPGAPSCCDSPPAAERIGYTRQDIASAPPEANLGLGCGNPLALAGIREGETVLDLGSGAGFDCFLAASRVGPRGRVIGIDLTPEMVEQARRHAAAHGRTNVEFHLADIEQLPVEDASVDLVISNCVLCLVPDKTQAFREVARVLKPGGRIAISDIVLDGPLPEALKDDPDAYCSCISGAARRADYLAAVESAGLADIAILSETDASDLLASDCCSTGVQASDLRGVATSVHITARKPSTGDQA